MLRFLTYFLSFLKLLWIGKWYPPAYVQDVSVAVMRELIDTVNNHDQRLRVIETALEATRKKVYRDEKKSEAEEVLVSSNHQPTPQNFLASLRDGDEVPIGINI